MDVDRGSNVVNIVRTADLTAAPLFAARVAQGADR
jgi:hypothetical protein